MSDDSRLSRFEATVLVHLDAAYRFARWLVADETLAQDAVQDACLKALRMFESRTGPSTKAWFIAVVRNACLDSLRAARRRGSDEPFDDEIHGGTTASIEATDVVVSRSSDARWIHAEIARLPFEFREVVVLREIEELSYKEIGAIARIPIGTVMSRLSRGRDLLAERMRAEAARRAR